MPTNLDTLQIEIKSSATDASSAIKNLESALKNLNKQLDLKDGTKLVTILNTLSGSANDFSTKINNITGSGFNKVTKGAENAQKAIQQLKKEGEDLQKTLEGFHTPDLDKAFGLAFSKKRILGEDAAKGNPKITETGFIIPNWDDSAPQRVAEAVQNITQKAKDLNEEMDAFHFPDFGNELKEADTFGKIANQAQNASNSIGDAVENIRKFKALISGMESGKIKFNEEDYARYIKGLNEAETAVKNYKQALTEKMPEPEPLKSKTLIGDFLPQLLVLGEKIEEISGKFNNLADKGVSLFKKLITPLKMAASEYVEKFEHMKASVEGFKQHFEKSLTKMSQFWKRTMRTFTFMIIRKAFTAVIKEVGNAIQSLAMYSNAMGTAFNTDLSNMVADFQYVGRAIVSAFAPLLSIVGPIIDAITSKIATLLTYIGMLFSLLGGKTTFTKPKKNVDNYAESLDNASKSAKNLTMGIDELNIISENKSSGGSSKPFDGWEDAWEEMQIPQWLKDLFDWLKNLFKRFFDPLKEAWNRAKQYLIDGFKTMMDSILRLLWHMLDDFLTMWNQEKTIRMFEMMLRIVGDLMRVVRNLANQFDKAWQKGKVGLRIFENLRDILATIVDHVRNVSYYMIGWADSMNFSPLLESFELLTRKMVKLADFLGGIFEDIMIEGVLKYIKFLIEDAIPHLQETLAEIIDTFNFNALREKLRPLWSAIEEVLEQIHTGVTNTIGNLGKEIARFTNSEEFTDFLQRIVDILNLITAERVEKILTGIGKGILAIAKSIIKFINSEPFMKFLQAIADWIDNHSVDQIAGILEKIANAILLFKFGAFATEKIAGFLKFFAAIKALQDLATIASGFKELGAGMEGAASGAGALAVAGEGLLIVFGEVVGILALKGEFDLIKDATYRLSEGVETLSDKFKVLAEILGGLHLGNFASNILGPVGILASKLLELSGIMNGLSASNFESVMDAVLTKGDTTVAMVKDWFSGVTADVQQNVQTWTDTIRNLTQDEGDLANYSQTLETLESAFRGTTDMTVLSSKILTQKYQDMTTAIDNYVMQSTDALKKELEDNREYYESKGKNVDDMIAKIDKQAEEEMQIYQKTQEAVNNSAKAYEDAVEKYGYGSKKAEEAYKTYEDAVTKHIDAIKDYRTETEKIDTTYASQQIEKLGKSLDLSQYSNMEDAASDIKGALEEIRVTYEKELSSVNSTVEEKMAFLKEQFEKGRIDQEEYDIGLKALAEKAEEDGNTLTEAYQEALDLFDQQLAAKLEDVKTNAEAEWEEANPIKRFFMGSSKDAYVASQMQTYVDEMLGESGLAGELQAAFEKLPGDIEPVASQSMSQIVEDTSSVFNTWDQVINADSLKEAVGNVFNSAGEKVSEWGAEKRESISTWVEETKTSLTEKLGLMRDSVEQSFDSLPEAIGYALGFVSGKLIEWGAELIAWAETNIPLFVDSVVEFFATLPGKIWEKLVEVKAKFDEWKTELITWVTTEIPLIVDVILKFFGEIPTKLYNLGTDIINGLLNGIKDAWEALKGGVKEFCDGFLQGFKDALGIASPSKEAETIGDYVIEGLFLPFTKDQTSTLKVFVNAFLDVFRVNLSPDKFTVYGNNVIQGLIQPLTNSSSQFVTAVNQIFVVITETILTNIQTLGVALTEALTTFVATYILPFFDLEMWQPILDNLMNAVFIPNFELFRTWFTESMTVWWEEDVLFWFTNEKWDGDIFTPLADNIHEHWNTFSSWWDTTMNAWWNNQVVPWFAKAKWLEQFKHILEAAKETFEEIKRIITEQINEAQQAVSDACETMKASIAEVITAIGELMDALSGLEGLGGLEGGKFTIAFGGGAPKFAEGGFPTRGSLFWAGEQGPELLGSIGGHTAVASNDEITGIANAVYATGNTEAELLGQLITVTRMMLDKDPVVISDKEIARMNLSGQNKLGMSIIT